MAASPIPDSTSHCGKCGNAVEPKARFCTACGAPLTLVEMSPREDGVSKTTDGKAEVYLKRAWGLIKGVEKATETFRERALQHDAQSAQDQPFVAGLVRTVRSAGQLKREKVSLLSDLDLATSEIDRAATANPDSVVHTELGQLGIVALRATVLFLKGQIEMIWGRPEQAKAIWFQAIQLAEFPEPHYMIGPLYEDEYKPQEALKHFERCLELEPDGELSVPALREANAMRNYKKRFRGSWFLCLVMLLFFFPAAIVYFVVKYR